MSANRTPDTQGPSESFYREAMENWSEHKKTGLHLTGGEVAAWLDTWETDSEQAAPPCHG